MRWLRRRGSAAIIGCAGDGLSRHSRSYGVAVASLFMTAFFAYAFATEPLKNHYNDPFIQVTNALKQCPQPRGPFMTIAEANAEAHPRIERGTTCFQSGKCKQANAYFYDPQIARTAQAMVEKELASSAALRRSSVWLTVQRRFVFVQGCVASASQIARWEALIKRVPDVEYVGVDLAVGTAPKNGRMPYPLMQ
ncbi:MAG: BON domain-containing protein [Casimicrobium sp.]